jgi:glycosyltransferase involved in cell wall biosynthesis
MAITGAFQADGGVAAVNRLVIQSLSDLGYHLTVLALVEDSVGIDGRYAPGAVTTYRSFGSNKARFTLALWRALCRDSFDLVMADLVNVSAALVPLAMLGRCRYVVWLHGVDVFPPAPTWEGRIGLRHAWRALASSEFTAASVRSRFPDVPIMVCELALDPVRHSEAASIGAKGGEPAITLTAFDGSLRPLGSRFMLHVARMAAAEKLKGQDTLLKAFPAIKSACADAQLVLVGQGDDIPRLRALAAMLPPAAQHDVFFPGYVGQGLLNRLYEACYAFVMPSVGEGFGLAYLEAMSRAKPCIGARAFATPCVIREGVTGLLVADATCPDQVAAAVCELLSDEERARRMGQEGLRLALSTYRFEEFRRRFREAIST